MTKKKLLPILICVLLSIPFSACSNKNSSSQTNIQEPTSEVSSAPEQRKLTICLGYQPDSLYIYKAGTQVDWDILQAVYDGPFDTIAGETIPVILESLPSIENGEIEIRSVTAQEGDTILNTAGEPVSLAAGVTYFPSGCNSADCAVQWNGSDPVTLDQAVITFQLKPDLLWSDGTPLTSQDSVFSYTLAADPATPNKKTSVDQISNYSAVDDTTIEAMLLPGFIPTKPEAYFFSPLPWHSWGEYSAAEIASAAFANQTPLGWGAYQITEWNEDSILLEKNPYYFRADEGLPYFDQLEFRFVSNQGDTNIASLDFDYAPYEILEYNWSPDGKTVYTDQCDVADSTVVFSDQYDLLNYLVDYYITPALQVNALPNSILEGLWLNPERSELTALQPILSMSIDRTYINSKTNFKLAFPTDSLFGVDSSSEGYGYDLDTAAQMLDEMGWIDDDGKPDTPRIAKDVPSVEDGTPLVITMTIPETPFYERESTALQASLLDSGIQLEIKTVQPWNFQASDGPLATGDFDIIPVSQTISASFPCSALNEDWLAFVLPGIEKNKQLKQLCENAVNENEETQAQIENALPLIPLFYHADVSIARSDMCGFTPTVGSTSDLWNLEEFNYGDACSQ